MRCYLWLMLPELPGFACPAPGLTYKDCSPACGHCRDKSIGMFNCDECVQGCSCENSGDVQESLGNCVAEDKCSCKLPSDDGSAPAGTMKLFGCRNWWVTESVCSIRRPLLQVKYSIIKIRMPSDRLIFKMGIFTRVKRNLYFETIPLLGFVVQRRRSCFLWRWREISRGFKSWVVR